MVSVGQHTSLSEALLVADVRRQESNHGESKMKILVLALAFQLAAVLISHAEVVPLNPRCELLTNPVGIDEAAPRLSWILKDAKQMRGQKQTAYRVLVASSPGRLAKGQGDLWDSGKVESDQSVHVVYSGKALTSHQLCYWKVKVWDKDGEPSAWTEPSTWSMGILEPSGWGAKWLSHTPKVERKLETGDPARRLNFDDCAWVWAPGDKALADLPAGQAIFRSTVELPADAQVDWAYLLMAADDRYWLWVNGRRTSISRDEPEAWRHGYEVELTEKLHPGVNTFAIQVTNREPGPAGLAGKLVVRLADGSERVVPIDSSWKVSARGGRHWQRPEFDHSKWSAARPVAKVGDAPWGVPQTGHAVGWAQTAPSPVFRKSFSIDKTVRRATAYVTGVGYYELSLNGNKVGDHVLDPAFTRYDRSVLYSSYDVTQSIRQGANALGMMLGNGWYNMHTRATWDFDQAPWRGEPRMLLHLRIELADGSVRTIVSDESWKASTGPIVLDGIRTGEVYDARRENPGWDSAGFDDSSWKRPAVAPAPGGELKAQAMPPLRVTETIRPVSVRETRPGVYLFDLGRNIAGWVRLRVKGPAGTEVTMRYSELAREDGSLERTEISKFNFQGPFQQDTYILKGGGKECWEPRFVYHGFQYVEVSGFPGEPTLEDLDGRMVHTDFESRGSFRCSNELLNRIQELTLISYLCNYHGYPTDCPQREKNGWTGDAHLAAEQGLFNWNSASAYAKWIADIRGEQRDSGEIAAIIPTGGWGYTHFNGPAWDSAHVLIPWYVYLYTGDLRILENNYESMKKYVDYMKSQSPNLIADFGLGDWAPADTKTPRDVTSTGYFYVDTLIVAQTAALLKRDEEAAEYEELAARIRTAFNGAYAKPGGDYANGSQTALSCALYQGLVPDAEKAQVVERLVAAVHARDDHVDVGILGAKYLFNTLSDNGCHELAYRVATGKTPPSYGHWVEQGATTLWEHWDGHSSLNHIMFGDISAWMYKYLAGIRLDNQNPGFKHVRIHPLPPKDLAWAEGQHESMYGPIRSRWERKGDGLVLNVAIPPNSTGTVTLPADKLDDVTESGQPLTKAPGVRVLCLPRKAVHIESGSYEFVIRKVQ